MHFYKTQTVREMILIIGIGLYIANILLRMI